MLKDFALLTKYPYTAGVIACVWLAAAIMCSIDTSLPLVRVAEINLIFTTFIAAIGFKAGR